MSDLRTRKSLVAWLNNLVPMRLRVMRRQWMKRQKVKKWLQEMKGKALSDAERDVVEFLLQSPFNYSMIPYPFALKHDSSGVAVCFDKARGMHYVMTGGKRLYYPASWQPYSIKAMHNQLVSEQDIESPHRYEREGWGVREGDVVVDAGAAEGFFALSVIDRARRVVLVESSPEWLSALQATFAPFPEKTVFIQKLIAGESGDSSITLDDIMLMEGRIDFVKADIEGWELEMLKGGANTLAQPHLRLAIAAYHRGDDADVISSFLQKKGFSPSFGSRLLLVEDFDDGRLELRRGICYAEKKSGINSVSE